MILPFFFLNLEADYGKNHFPVTISVELKEASTYAKC